MKTYYKLLPILFLIFIIPPKKAGAHDDYTKVIKKEYAVNPNAQLVLDNKFGQIHCNNWDKNVVSVEVRITVSASSQEKATKQLDLVNIAWEGSPTNVSVKTNFDKDGFSGSSKVSVDYTVNMPATLDLDMTNKFGDAYVNELTGAGNFHISYGNLDINKLMNSKNVVDIKFGKGNIRYITGAMVSLRYSEMQVDFAGSLYIDSKFSDIEGNKINSLSVGLEGGKLDVENNFMITGSSKFTDLNFSNLEKKMDLNIQYGNCEVNQVGSEFSLISVKNKFGNISVNIPSGVSYSLDADLKFCDLDFPEENANFTQKIIENTSKSYRATVGKDQNPVAKVVVRSEYGNVSLQ